MAGFLKVKLVHSGIGRTQRQKDTLRALGLRRLRQERILKDLPPIRGMIQKVLHLVEYEETDQAVSLKEDSSDISYQINKS